MLPLLDFVTGCMSSRQICGLDKWFSTNLITFREGDAAVRETQFVSNSFGASSPNNQRQCYFWEEEATDVEYSVLAGLCCACSVWSLPLVLSPLWPFSMRLRDSTLNWTELHCIYLWLVVAPTKWNSCAVKKCGHKPTSRGIKGLLFSLKNQFHAIWSGKVSCLTIMTFLKMMLALHTHVIHTETIWIFNIIFCWEWPNHIQYTSSHPITEVKQFWAKWRVLVC